MEEKAAKRQPPIERIAGVPKPLNLETIRWRAVVVARGQGQRLRHLLARRRREAGRNAYNGVFCARPVRLDANDSAE